MDGDLCIDGELNATLVAPVGYVALRSRNVGPTGVSHRGAVYANAVELHQGTRFVSAPLAFDWTELSE
ncbi:MAG: hypothetical protein JW751_02880 [Polyangiaceae bacterium]|nr:hypothetical protein [Polyangiaceae bacterium]